MTPLAILKTDGGYSLLGVNGVIHEEKISAALSNPEGHNQYTAGSGRISGLKNEMKIHGYINGAAKKGGWKDVAAKDATAFLEKHERHRKADVYAHADDVYKAHKRDARGRLIENEKAT